MNFTPYEMKILLEVHCGMSISAARSVPLFHETMDDFTWRGLVLRQGYEFRAGPALPGVIGHVLNAPRPMSPGRRDLTKQQLVIFDYLIEYHKQHSFSPTRREIAERFGFKSQNAAQSHLEALARKGYVELGRGRMRAIRAIP